VMKKICVIGLGYIGLPTASMFAAHGYQVVGVDSNPDAIKSLTEGEIRTTEEGLSELVKQVMASGNLVIRETPAESDVWVICVQTPVGEDNKANLSNVISAAQSIVSYLQKGNLVILESTVPPGTTRDLINPMLEKSGLKIASDLYVSYCPERVLPGRILKEIAENDRIIGGINIESAELAKRLYRTFVSGNIYLTDTTTAEMTKLMENTYRDVNIALANEFARICDSIGINVWEAISLANRHPRVDIHLPGPGVGGHCIPIDPKFIVEKAPKNARLIKLAGLINDEMPSHVVELVIKGLKLSSSDIAHSHIAVLGLAYKKEIDDTRESPARGMIDEIVNRGGSVKTYDPYAKSIETEAGQFKSENSIEETLKDADCALFLTDHSVFKEINLRRAKALMRHPVIVDCRNIFDSAKVQGFVYLGLGKAAGGLRNQTRE
jgi:UDP-N-acetyl-D-mannosaminuronic acid dehydrogenase